MVGHAIIDQRKNEAMQVNGAPAEQRRNHLLEDICGETMSNIA
jgi:hypothetical protein